MMIRANSIKNTEIKKIIEELEQNKELMSYLANNSGALKIGQADIIEAIASVISYNDNDVDVSQFLKQ